LKLDSEKSKSRKTRTYTSSRKWQDKTNCKDNEEDILKPHENKLKPLEIDTSHLQGNTEGVLHRQGSNASLHKMASVRNSNQDDCSLQDISFSHT
jgi:hypothetical protein